MTTPNNAAGANAHLIAAALYEALRELVEQSGNPSPDALKRAEAALSAAEGKDNG